MMNNENKRNVPELRFAGFTDAWEKRKLGDIYEVYSGQTPDTKDSDNFDNPTTPWVRTTDLTNSYIFSTTMAISEFAKKKLKVLPSGTVLIAMYGGLQQIGRTGLLTTPSTINQALSALPPATTVDSYFLITQLNAKCVSWRRLAASSRKDPNITKKDVKNFKVATPSILNQRQIGSFFSRLDDTIALHQRKQELLLKLKKGYLQKLFPKNGEDKPELRFAGFTDAWEKRKLGELVTMIDGDRGSNYPHESDFRPEGETVFLDTGNVRPEGFNLSSRKYISATKNQQLRSGLLTEGDFVMTTRGTLGNVAYYESDIQATYPKVRINSAMLILRPTGRVANGLLLSLLRGNLIAAFLKKDHVGSAQPHITKRDFSKMLVSFPSDDIEQDKIGSFLRSLNDTIALHQRKLDELKKLKKAYLQKMFV